VCSSDLGRERRERHCFVPMILAEPVGEVAADPTTTSTA
jgi:hypothetical protein